MSRWVKVAEEGACPVGALRAVSADGIGVVLANVDGRMCALRDLCSHEEYPLSDGELEGDEIVCIYHGARFDACTGARKALPAIRPVQAYPVEIRDGHVWIDIG